MRLTHLLVICGLLLGVSACTAPDRTVEVLDDAGYTDVQIEGYAWFDCSEDDVFQTEFIAKNPNGKVVDGAVCCGWFKNCTIRH